MGETKEIAKAVQEVAKTTTALAANRRLGEFVARTIGEPIESIMGIVTDRLQFMRWERYARLVDRASQIMSERKLQGKTRIVPPKIALPIIENASLEEDDFLQDMWVNLLITAMDDSKDEPRTAYIEIIKQLALMDAKILKHLYDAYAPHRYLVRDPKEFPEVGTMDEPYVPKMIDGFTLPSKVAAERGTIKGTLKLENAESFETSIDNLVRVGCASLIRDKDFRFSSIASDFVIHDDHIYITSLGANFVDACM